MNHPRLCSSRPVLVQPVEGSNLLFVLDPDKKGRCVESSKLARSDPTCQDHVTPMLINRGGELTITYSVKCIMYMLRILYSVYLIVYNSIHCIIYSVC